VIPPAQKAVVIAPHDTNPLAGGPTQGIYVGGAGNIVLRAMNSPADVTLIGVPVGAILPIRALYVRATSTTATNLVAFY
jgi:hypothetical protein